MPRRRVPFNGGDEAGDPDPGTAGGALAGLPDRPQAPQSADEWLAYLKSMLWVERAPGRQHLARRLLLVAPLTALVIWTGLPYRYLASSVAALAVLGAVLAIAAGVLGQRQRLDASEAAYDTSVLLFQLAHVSLYLLVAVPLVTWVLSRG